MIGRFGHRSAHSLGRRTLYALRSYFLGGVSKAQAVYFVEHRGHRYKRVVFGDSRQAELVELNMQAVAVASALPRLILRHEREVWVEFVHGRALDPTSATDLTELATFYADLYRGGAHHVALADTAWHEKLQTDLWFLARSGVLASSRAEEITRHAEDIKPETVWQGYDYVDPVAKNFVVATDGLKAIDIESFQADQLLGTGIAKAGIHWPDFGADDFVARMIECGAPDFRAQQRYTELCFIAGWTKRKVLTGKHRYIQPERFDGFR